MANDDRLGALWEKNDGDYMTGKITINGETVNIVVFKNKNKTEEKHPDWNILKSKPRS